MINVHGDSMGTAIVERLCRSQLQNDNDTLSLEESTKNRSNGGQQIYPEISDSKL